MEAAAQRYRSACGMVDCFNVLLRRLATGEKFEYRMEFPTALVGSDPRCHFRLPPEIASGKEMLFQVIFGRIFCLALGDANEESHRIKRRLLGAGRIEVNGFEVQAFEERGGNTEIERSPTLASERQSGDPPLGQFELAMRNQGRRDVVVPLTRPIAVMGRSPRCRVIFNSWSASKFHAACVATPEGVWVVDLKSRTGTFVNEVPVRLQLLRAGDRLRIGPSRFEFRVASSQVHESEAPPAAKPPRTADVIMSSVPSVPATRASLIEDESELAEDGEVLALVSSLAGALAHGNVAGVQNTDARAISRTLSEMLRMQSLQLDEMRRLTAYLSAHQTLPAGLLGNSSVVGSSGAESTPIKPTGALTGSNVEPDVHEWFQQENEEAEERSVARLLRRILGSR